MAQADLRRVARAARKRERAEAELYEAIVAARASGETYRDIAKAAGLSHQGVWKIMQARQPPSPE
jgi:transcriptional regulator with XRE-family HTH domain